ncbi:hypothetical protein [Mangrovicoccus ximenensis]|uniref:hypothetical protein n=1 Tax=Mangrovicoccus ximenensis TaxID=1911570 RepID=UPI000D339D92|nr:hypothetical protein [Mangrovicoccus ximenensis]
MLQDSLCESSYAGNPAPTVARQWLRDGAPISGATGASYAVPESAVGSSISCRETATNSQGSIQSVSNAIGPIVSQYTPPVASVQISAATATVGATLTLTVSATGDVDTLVPTTTLGGNPLTLVWSGTAASATRTATYVTDTPGTLSLSVTATGPLGSDTAAASAVIEAAPVYTTTVAPISTQSVAFFDSGAAFDRNSADIPVSGTTTAPDGTALEGRMVRYDNGAELVSWAPLVDAAGDAISAASGAYSGFVPWVPRSQHRMRVQVRPVGSNSGQAATPVVVGHILVLLGQSEEAYMFSPWLDTADLQAARQTVSDEEALRVISYRNGGDYPGTDYATNGILPVTNSAMLTSSLGAMSNFLAQNAPGERFLMIEAAVSGTTYWNLASDDPAVSDNEQSDRTWDGSFAGGVRMLRDYGAEPGVLMSTWTAAPATTSDGYRRRLYPLYTGRYAPEQGGADYVLGTDPLNNRPYDYLFYDLTGQGRGELDPSKTKAYFYGPHRFEHTELSAAKEDTRESTRRFAQDALALFCVGKDFNTLYGAVTERAYGPASSTTKTVGVDALPSGVTWDAGNKILTIDTGTFFGTLGNPAIFEGWRVPGKVIVTGAGSYVTLRQNDIGGDYDILPVTPGAGGWLDIESTGTDLAVRNNTIRGPGGYVRQSLTGDAWHDKWVGPGNGIRVTSYVTRLVMEGNNIYGAGLDQAVIRMKEGISFRYNRLAQENPRFAATLPLAPYDAGTTYAAGDMVLWGSNVAISKIGSNTGNQPPAYSSTQDVEDANWIACTYLHSDMLTVGGQDGSVVVEENLFEFRRAGLQHLSAIARNWLLVWSAQQSGNMVNPGTMTFRRNVSLCDRKVVQFPIYAPSNDAASRAFVYGNIVNAQQDGDLFHPVTGYEELVCGNNVDASSGRLLNVPAYATAYSGGDDCDPVGDIPHMAGFVGPEIMSYESGFQAVGAASYTAERSSADSWIDIPHPSRYSPDGSPRRAQYTALAMLHSLGVGPDIAQAQDSPRFNRSYWEPSGAYAEFWFEAATNTVPPITTTRIARSISAMPSTLAGTAAASQTAIGGTDLPHRTDVAGFEIDGEAAENVTIVGGRVRVLPNSGSFDGNTRIDFGRGGGVGIHTVDGLADADVIEADLFDRIWLNYPIVTGLVSGVEGVPLRPMPDQAEVGSTLPAEARFSVAGTTAIFDDANWGASTPLTVKFRLVANPASGAEEGLLRMPVGSGEIKLSLLNNTQLRYSFVPGGVSSTDVASPLPYAGVMREFVITADPATGAFGLYVDGVEVRAQASGTAGAFSGNYGIRLLGLSNGGSMATADVESITIWDVYTSDGSDPAGTPYKDIRGIEADAIAAAKASPNPFTWYVGGVAQ